MNATGEKHEFIILQLVYSDIQFSNYTDVSIIEATVVQAYSVPKHEYLKNLSIIPYWI